MNESVKKLFSVLFDKEDCICVALSSKGTQISPPAARYSSQYEFFSVNPILGDADRNPTRSFHSFDKPRRSDVNVTKYRNMVFEVDKGSLEFQKSKINELVFQKGFPITAIVFSGKKSYHMHVSLEVPLENEIEYRKVWEKTYCWLEENGLMCDKVTKNPSRLSRYPGNIRYDTKKEQELIYLGKRVSKERFDKFLSECPEVNYTSHSGIKSFDTAMGHYNTVFGTNPNDYGASRHVTLWSIGMNLAESGAPEEVVDYLLQRLNESWGEENLTEAQMSERLESIFGRR